MASSLADSQAQDAAAEEARLVELALKDSVEEAMGMARCTLALLPGISSYLGGSFIAPTAGR